MKSYDMANSIKVTLSKQSRLGQFDIENLPFGRVFTDHMFEADYIYGQWTNLQIKPLELLKLHPANLALHYGQSIFEGMKASINKDGVPLLFRPELHAKRMNASARRMSMPEVPEDLFLDALHALVGIENKWIPRKKGSALYIRPIMFATDAFLGVKASESFKLLVLTLPVGPYYPKPIRLWAEKKYIRAAAGGVGEAKAAGNYAAALYPAKKANENGFDQVLWLDAVEHRYTQEVGTMNIFFVVGDQVLTPSTDGTILKGITRMSAIEILKDRGVAVEERPVPIDEIVEAYKRNLLREVFGTGTAAVVSEVEYIEGDDFILDLSSRDMTFSSMIKEEINELRIGNIEDTRGWTVPVRVKIDAGVAVESRV